ncbi:MAG TPA: hypothetical protein VFD93_03085, partial [Candidatus Acidoferrales bacterium]|nr:hypothetical protein [Candidatus Acidoferrales bacterium]
MKTATGFLVVAVGLLVSGATALAQQAKIGGVITPAPTVSSVMVTQSQIVWREFLSAAKAMPEDKYNFAPTEGNFKGVRTFAQEVKHVATVN